MPELSKIKTNDLEFDYRVSGGRNGEPVILLHGFPETSIMWVRLMGKLASMGYYCVAPNMRGYSQGACPNGAINYAMENLTDDVIAIADALEIERFHLIGHDWGSLVGWNVVRENQMRVLSWSSLSVPCIRAFRKAMKIDPGQKKKVRYMGFFLIPLLPEIYLRRKDFALFKRLWKYSSPDVIEDYLSVFRRKGALTAALNYYRANVRRRASRQHENILTPTLFIWGNRDLAIGQVAAYLNGDYMAGDYTFVQLEAGHWLVQEAYIDIERAILDHIVKYKVSISE